MRHFIVHTRRAGQFIARPLNCGVMRNDDKSGPLRVLVGYAAGPSERYDGLAEALLLLTEDLNQLIVAADVFSKRSLHSLTLAIDLVDEEIPPSLARSYIGHDKRNPRIDVYVVGGEIRNRRDNIGAMYSFLLPKCVRGLDYAAKKLRLPSLDKVLRGRTTSDHLQR